MVQWLNRDYARNLIAIFLVVMLLPLVSEIMGAHPATKPSSHVIRVPEDYPSIQEAVDHAGSGAIIIVSRGVYHESLAIKDLSGLRIIGREAVITGDHTRNIGILIENSTSITISGLSLDNYTRVGILLSLSRDISINNTSVRGSVIGLSINASTGVNITGIRIENASTALEINGCRDVRITRSTLSYQTYLLNTANGTGIRIYMNNIDGPPAIITCGYASIVWHSPGGIQYMYRGRLHEAILGNHWGGYSGRDADGNGVGEEPYPFIIYDCSGRIRGRGQDYNPLIDEIVSYTVIPHPFTPRPPVIGPRIQDVELAMGEERIINLTIMNPNPIYMNLTIKANGSGGVRARVLNPHLIIPPGGYGNVSVLVEYTGGRPEYCLSTVAVTAVDYTTGLKGFWNTAVVPRAQPSVWDVIGGYVIPVAIYSGIALGGFAVYYYLTRRKQSL